MELYKKLARTIDARNNCIKNNNQEWQDRHEDTIQQLIEMLPHGSGLDGTWKIDIGQSGDQKIILYMSYHAMDENGFYDGWINFMLTIKPSLMFGFNLNIKGNFGKYQGIKDYLYDALESAIRQEIE